jgi:ABC-type nitrate/sulfonate/bicarbonate transport system permease component
MFRRSLLVGWIVLLTLWLSCSYVLGVPEYLLASPGRVWHLLVDNASMLSKTVALTASQAFCGWVLAVILGGITGAVIFYVPWGRGFLLPPLIALQTTPIIALAPLITFWFGYGWVAKVVVAAIVAMFPVVLAMYSGLGDSRQNHINLYKLAGVHEPGIFWHIRLRSAWTTILASLKVAAIFAVIGSIVAEFMGGNSGLGFLIMKAIYGAKGDLLLAAIILSALIGQLFLLSLEAVVRTWERRVGGPGA